MSGVLKLKQLTPIRCDDIVVTDFYRKLWHLRRQNWKVDALLKNVDNKFMQLPEHQRILIKKNLLKNFNNI